MEAPVNNPTEPDMHGAKPETNPSVAHEGTDANARAITRFGIALGVVVAVSQVLLWGLFNHFSSREAKLSPPVPAFVEAQAPKEPPNPRLQANPQLDMRKMLREEDDVLTHYGWVDPGRGIVRIPIQRAIDLVAQKGLPQFKAAGGKAGESPAGARPQTRP